ncbi:MAG: PIN domain-containing protein [bacterium]
MARSIYLDTNYFLRFLLKDNPKQFKIVSDLLNQAKDGKVVVITSVVTILEIHWVLSSTYEYKKEKILDLLTKLLKLNFIQFIDKDIIENALKTYQEEKLELEDCLHLAYAKSASALEFETFDKKLISAMRS